MFFSGYKTIYRYIFSIISLILLLGAGALIAYFVRFSGTDVRVCNRCHPKIASLWKESNGHKVEQAKCYQCHSEKIRILPSGLNVFRHYRDQLVPPEYSADDDLISQQCLECHNDVLDLGYTPKKKVINFNHRIHLGERLKCMDCHRSSGHEYMTASSNRPTIYECIQCHYKEFEGPPKSRKCLNCHDVMLAPGRTW